MKFSLALWGMWCGYWILSMRKRVRDTSESPTKREPLAGRVGYLSLIVAGFVLLFWHVPVSWLEQRLWPADDIWLAIGLAVQAAGLGFAIWARQTLGRNWSGRITTGASQELVIRGPYRMVRHPIQW